MPVVINEFEVIAEPQQQPRPQERSASGREQTQGGAPLRPADIFTFQERHQQRLARLFAD